MNGRLTDYQNERKQRNRSFVQKSRDRDLYRLAFLLNQQKTLKEFLMEADKRIKVLRTAHYTTSSNKNEILRSGFKDSPSSGTYHPDTQKNVVYTTPSSRVGSDYSHSRVNLRIVNPKITTTDSPRDFGPKIKSWLSSSSDEDIANKKNKPTSAPDQAKKAFQQGAKIVRVPDAHGGFVPKPGQPRGSYVMMTTDVANKSIEKNRPPTLRARQKPRMSSSLRTTGTPSTSRFIPGQGDSYGIGGIKLAN